MKKLSLLLLLLLISTDCIAMDASFMISFYLEQGRRERLRDQGLESTDYTDIFEMKDMPSFKPSDPYAVLKKNHTRVQLKRMSDAELAALLEYHYREEEETTN